MEEVSTIDIDLVRLRSITLKVFDHIIATRGISHVKLQANYYWNVPSDALFDVSKQPQQLDIGSVADEWEFVNPLADESGIPIAYNLTQIAPILLGIGLQLSKALAAKGG